MGLMCAGRVPPHDCARGITGSLPLPHSLTVTFPPESSSKLSSNTFDTATPVNSKFTISCVETNDREISTEGYKG